jgi:uncharacterized protein YchJ
MSRDSEVRRWVFQMPMVLVDLERPGGYEVLEMQPERDAPDHLVRELWALLERRHPGGAMLRRRDAQFKAAGATLWRPVARPARVIQKPGPNAPCPCGSGRKFKKCCQWKDAGA